jgi:hypothetical protein
MPSHFEETQFETLAPLFSRGKLHYFTLCVATLLASAACKTAESNKATTPVAQPQQLPETFSMAVPAKAPGLEPATTVTNDTTPVLQTQDKEQSLVDTPDFAISSGH